MTILWTFGTSSRTSSQYHHHDVAEKIFGLLGNKTEPEVRLWLWASYQHMDVNLLCNMATLDSPIYDMKPKPENDKRIMAYQLCHGCALR